MTKIQELLGKILQSRIKTEKEKGILDVEEMQETISMLLADGQITVEQYAEFKEMIVPVEENTDETITE